jgi:hypothetical protein
MNVTGRVSYRIDDCGKDLFSVDQDVDGIALSWWRWTLDPYSGRRIQCAVPSDSVQAALVMSIEGRFKSLTDTAVDVENGLT